MKDLNKWAEDLQREVYLFWKENKKYLPYGFAVFYSPVYENSDILIIGYNPGGKEDSFIYELGKFKKGDFSLPKILEYLKEDYLIARRIRELFLSVGLDLKKLKVVKTNLIFFRTPSLKELYSINPDLRIKIELFSKEKINDIIFHLKPKIILCEGTNTFYKLIKFLDKNKKWTINAKTILKNEKSVVIGLETFIENQKIIGILHPSYRFFSSYEEDIKNFLRNMLNNA